MVEVSQCIHADQKSRRSAPDVGGISDTRVLRIVGRIPIVYGEGEVNQASAQGNDAVGYIRQKKQRVGERE